MKSLNFIKCTVWETILYSIQLKRNCMILNLQKDFDRKTGIGCDLVVVTRNSDTEYCDIYAKFINSDGTRRSAEML